MSPATLEHAPRHRSLLRRFPPGVYLCYAVLLLFFLVPLAYLVSTSLKTPEEFMANPVGLVENPQLANYPEAWSLGNFGRYILNTALYTVLGATGATAFSLLLGFPLARGYIGGAKFWNGMLASFLFLPNALVPQFQMLYRMNLYNTQAGYIIMCAMNLGVGPILFRGYAQSIPRELDEAAAADGCGYWRYLWNFVIPMSRPALVTIFILDCVWIWNDFILAQVLLANRNLWPIATGLNAFKGVYSTNWALLSAATLIVAIPLIAVYIFIQKYLVNGVVGAVKG
jgi:raffinose/stachyose/melibiose transport system permease protein